MAIKLNKAKTHYKIETNKTPIVTTVIIEGTDTDVENLDNQQIYAYRDVDSSEQFKILNEVGLSPLKAVVLANTEFIPIGSGQENARNVIKVNLGEDQGAVAVNNVARLMVLHRQIRAVSLHSANKILNETKNFDVHKFYRIARKIIKSKYKALVNNKTSIDEVIDAAIDYLIKEGNAASFTAAVQLQVHKTVTPKPKPTARELAVDQAFDTGTSEEDAAEPSQTQPRRRRQNSRHASKIFIRRVARSRKSDPFFRTLIEYMIHEILIVDIIQYLAGLQSLREFVKKNYSISNITQTTQAFEDAVSAFQLQDSEINLGLDEFLGSYETDARNFGGAKSSYIGQEKKSALLNLIAENALDVGSPTVPVPAGGYIMMTQAGLSAIRNVSCYQSLVSEIGQSEKFKARPHLAAVWNYSSANDLCRAMFNMRSTSLYTMANNGPPSEVRSINNGLRELHSRANGNKYYHARGSIDEDRDTSVANEKRRTWAEMLVASIFDTTYTIQKHHLMESKKTKALRQLGRTAPTRPIGIKEYFREMYGEIADEMIFNPDLSYEFSPSPNRNIAALMNDTQKYIKIPEPKVAQDSSLGLFLSKFNKARRDNGKRYIPFESITGLYSGTQSLTGPEYFIDHALQIGDMTFEAATNFIKEYKQFGLNYYNDIVNLTGVKYVDRIFEDMCEDLANEFDKACATTHDYRKSLLHLALLLSDSTENEASLYNSAYFGSQLGPHAVPSMRFTKKITAGELFGENTPGIDPDQILTVANTDTAFPYTTQQIDRLRVRRYGPSSDTSLQTNILLDEGGLRATRKASNATLRRFMIEELGISSVALDHAVNLDSNFIDSEDSDTTSTAFEDSKLFVDCMGQHYTGLNGEKYTTYDRTFVTFKTKRLSEGGNNSERGKLQLDKAALVSAGDPPEPTSTERTITQPANGLCEYIIPRFSGGDGTMSTEQVSIDRGIKFTTRSMEAFRKYMDLEPFGCLVSKQSGGLNSSTGVLNRARTKVAIAPRGPRVEVRDNTTGTRPGRPVNVLAEECIGEFFDMGKHQRGEIYFRWVQSILKKSITLYAAGRNDDGQRNAQISILGNKFEMQGVASAFKRAARRLDLSDLAESDARVIKSNGTIGGFLGDPDVDAGIRGQPTLKAAAQGLIYTADHLNMVRNMISKRKRRILSSAMIFYLHAIHLEQAFKKARRYVKGDTALPSAKLMQSTLREIDFAKMITMTSPESVEQILNAHVNTFVSLPTKLFTPEDQLLQRKYNLCFKILTHPGYGLLSSEKRGNKTVLHVGVTNSMLEVMRLNAFQETGNRRFLNSTNICINVFKKNELNASESLYPKVFAFDTSKYIHDFDFRGNMHKHLSNFNLDWSFKETLDNLVVTRYVKARGQKSKNSKLTDDYRIVSFSQKEANEAGRMPRDILTNHAFDYALKNYYKFATGVDFGEYNFPIDNELSELSGQEGGFGRASADMQGDFDSLINQTRSIYPAANVDEDLAKFLFTNFETIGKNPVYTLRKRLRRVIEPKKFDRVFSILVNDKDFIIHPDSANKEFTEIYEQTPHFSLTSRISRRGSFKKNRSSGAADRRRRRGRRRRGRYNRGKRSVLGNYKRSCLEHGTEVYSYYVTISLLTDDAVSPDIFESTTKVELTQVTADRSASEFAKRPF